MRRDAPGVGIFSSSLLFLQTLLRLLYASTLKVSGLFAGQEVLKSSRIGSGRVGSGRVGSRGTQFSRVGSGRVKSCFHFTGQVGSGQELSKSEVSGRVRPRGDANFTGRVRS